MLASNPIFPFDKPDVYSVLKEEPTYDPAIHLDLEKPSNIELMDEFGYSQEDIDASPSPMAVAGPFRILSNEGVAAAKVVLDQLRDTAESDEGNRAPNYLAGGVYKSKFLRDLCACPVLIQHMSTIAGTSLAAHSIPHQQLYVNFAPEDISKAVDSWHIDSIDFDCVILLEDPHSFEGGHFQYFRGTDKQAADIFATTTDKLAEGFPVDLPSDRVVSVQKSQAGDAVFQQGSRVVHRAEKLHKPAERTTLVISYVARDANLDDLNNVAEIIRWKHPGTSAELARHCAWRSQARLANLIEELPIDSSASEVVKKLKFAIDDVEKLIGLLEK